MDILQQATRYLQKQVLKKFVAQSVTVNQGSDSYALTVTVAMEDAQHQDVLGVLYNSRHLDFLVDIDDMHEQGMRDFRTGDVFVWPLSHTDTDDDGNEVIVRQEALKFVAASDGTEPVARPDSRYRNWMRVHTKREGYERTTPPASVDV